MAIIIKIFVTFDTIWLDYSRDGDILRQHDYTSYMLIFGCTNICCTRSWTFSSYSPPLIPIWDKNSAFSSIKYNLCI